MTKLKSGQPLSRETAFTLHGRALLVELHPQHLEMRFKGTRKTYSASYEGLLMQAARRDAEHERIEKIRARLANKGSRS